MPHVLLLLLPSPALAATLEVGPGRTLTTPCAAAAVAEDGDTVQIDAGTYAGDVCAWTADHLTISGVGGYAHLDAAGESSGGKAIWVIQGDDTTVAWIEFSGATVPDQNGAGIRQEGAGLTVSHCWFHDNEDGILAGDNADSDIVIEHSVFDHNGYGDGYSHNLYINHVRSLVFQYNDSQSAHAGHELKSRAYKTVVAYNRLADGADGDGSYEIDLPNGGEVLVIGNLIQQGPGSQNSTMLTYAEEGAGDTEQSLYVVSNTFVNDLGRGTFVRNSGSNTAVLWDNLMVGGGTALDGPGEETSDLQTETPGFVDQASGDYGLTEGSPAIDAGADPGELDGVSLWPQYQVSGSTEVEARPVVGALDIGALEYGSADTGGGDSGPGDSDEPADSGAGDDSGSGDDSEVADTGEVKPGGCGCSTGPGAVGTLAWLCAALMLVGRRRR